MSTPGTEAEKAAAPPSSLAPFRYRSFTVLWAATVLSNIGTWMHDVGAGWLMTTLAPSPLMVALVQTATSLPILLFALPAGALADILDRRRLLIAVQLSLGVIALALGLLVREGLVTPWVLLLFTFAMGTGAALTLPAWQAIVPKLVPRETLQPAIALNSVGVNISRAIGPALGGFVIVAAGLAMPFLVNAASYLAVVVALIWWRPGAAAQRTLPPEHLSGAVRAGMRYARDSGPLRATLFRAVAFFLFASAYWALLPLIVRETLGAGPTLYGVLLGCVGAGAVLGAILLPPLRKRIGPDWLTAAGTLGMALVLAVAATVGEPVAAAAASLLAGASWIAVLTSLNVSAQVALPDWVRARGLAVFVMVFFGSMSAGALIWGNVAGLIGIPAALLIAAAGAVLVLPLAMRWKLQQGAGLDLTPAMHWPAPIVVGDAPHDRGPVLVTVEYRIDPARAAEFVAAMTELSRERRRDGAYAWDLFQDTADPARWLEYFLVASWLEHLRQHERVTMADRDVQEAARRFHIGDAPPCVTHYLAPDPTVSRRRG